MPISPYLWHSKDVPHVDIVKPKTGSCNNPFGAMNTIAELKLLPLWVDAAHLVSTAIHVMAGHKVKALGVIKEGRLLGTVNLETLAAAPSEETVEPFVHPLEYTVNINTPIRSVASMFVESDLDYAPVVDGDRFVGIVTPLHLLRELGRSFDPLTGLSWSDRLRDWGLENLRAGREVTILFIDLDEFGQYNKRYGHIVGDRVLQRLALFLSEGIDPNTDLLVRYGGDEFAIGTLRHRVDVEEMAEQMQTEASQLYFEETASPIGFSVGIYGGRRTRERDNMHYAATLDNLINRASQECMLQKKNRNKADKPSKDAVVLIPSPALSPPYTVAGVYFDERTTNGVTTVILSNGTTVVSGAHSRQGKPALESIAIATAKAVERAHPEHPIHIEDIHLVQNGDARVVNVSVRVSDTAYAGTFTVSEDLYEAAAEATVNALAPILRD